MTFTKQTSPHGSLVALSTMKDEGPTVVEWVAHHLAVGFTELMVYTNDCSDGTDTLLKRLEALDIGVHHRENTIPEGMKPHPSMLKLAAEEALILNSDWLLVLDADEFLCINHPSGTLDGLVTDLNAMDAHAMVLTWRIFGSSGVRDWSRAAHHRPVHPRSARVLEQGLGHQDHAPIRSEVPAAWHAPPDHQVAAQGHRLSRHCPLGKWLGPPAGGVVQVPRLAFDPADGRLRLGSDQPLRHQVDGRLLVAQVPWQRQPQEGQVQFRLLVAAGPERGRRPADRPPPRPPRADHGHLAGRPRSPPPARSRPCQGRGAACRIPAVP